MTITNCPRCGSMNITTAGVCANCGWSQFAQVTTVSTGITNEIKIMLSVKVLLDDYKRLLLENRNLKERIAELEAAQRWIPVSERLPEDLQPTVIITKGGMTGIVRYLELYGREGFGSWSEDVTHWMPLPQPPEVK